MPLSLWEQTTIGLVRGLKRRFVAPSRGVCLPFGGLLRLLRERRENRHNPTGSDRRLAGPTSNPAIAETLDLSRQMKPSPSTTPRRAPGSRRHAWERVARRTLYAKVAVLAVLLLAGAAVYVRLSSGPISMKWLGGRMAAALAEQIGPDWAVTVQRSALVLKDGALGLRATELEIRNPEGALVLRAPYAVLTVDTLPLLTASINPRSIELQDLQLRASVNPDGSLSFLPATEAGPERTGALADAAAAGEPASQSAAGTASVRPSSLSAALSSLFELIVDPAHIVGAIDTARVTNARLTLVDEDQRERVAFNRVDATFAHSQSRTRQFDMRLHGAYGPWRIGGQVFRGRGARRDGTIVITDIPIHDLLLLTGLSGMPAETDLKISARAEASLTKGVLERLEARLEGGSGSVQIEDKDTSPFHVDKLAASVSWDETQRRLALADILFKGGDTELKLAGELTTAADKPGWRLAVAGTDAVISGAMAADPPVKVKAVEAGISSDGRRLAFDRLSLHGDGFSVAMTGSYAGADNEGLRVAVDAKNVDVRSAMRLWPEGVASPVRRFLLPRLQGGTVESLNLGIALTPAELAHSMTGGLMPEKSLKLDFALRDTDFTIVEGAPGISQGRAEGRVTGGQASIKVPNGRIQMPDGRVLAGSEGSFAIPELKEDGSVAQIGFRLSGGADALAALLQEPVLRPLAGLDLDPSALKGRTDLRVNVALPIDDVPSLADMPMTMSGTIADLTVDKAFGRDKLEGGNLTIAYSRGSLNLRGEARLSGTPASIELRQSPAAPGELAVLLTLDEAARARRGLSLGNQLTGPIALRIGVPLGVEGKGHPKVEVDFAKAAIDNLIPGWSKPAGRPGRMTFVLNEGSPADIRDLVVDSGTVQMRGTASFSPDGNLEKADITTLKFSQGDDARAQLERIGGVYKVNVRGNVLDARPFLKSLTTAPAAAPASSRDKEPREQKDVDLDLAVNIVTGHNDEALTNGSLKVSSRSRELRHLQLSGRFRSAPVSAQLTRAARGSVVTLQSDDAGATLRFADIYKRMVGGQLTFQVSAGDAPQSGNIVIEGFALRNEPALRRIASQQTVAAVPDDRGKVASAALTANEVQFAKLEGDFTRTASRIEFRDAVDLGDAGRLHPRRLDRLRPRPGRHRRNLRSGLRAQQHVQPGAGGRPDPRRRPQRGAVRGQFPHFGTGELADPDGQPAVAGRARLPAQVLRRRRGPDGDHAARHHSQPRRRAVSRPSSAEEFHRRRPGRNVRRRAGGRGASCRRTA